VGRCLTFWYVMRGNQLGQVEVTLSNSKNPTTIWKIGGMDQGELWHFASVGFYSDEDYNVKIIFCLFYYLCLDIDCY
jgi:hypothetical protein